MPGVRLRRNLRFSARRANSRHRAGRSNQTKPNSFGVVPSKFGSCLTPNKQTEAALRPRDTVQSPSGIWHDRPGPQASRTCVLTRNLYCPSQRSRVESERLQRQIHPMNCPRPPRARAAVGLALALLMQVGLLAPLQLPRLSGKAGVSGLLELRLLAPAPVPSARPAPPAPVMARSAGPVVSRLPAAPAPERAAPDSQPPPPAGAISAGAAPAAAHPGPLNLALPSERAASGPAGESMLKQMLADPRANSVRRTPWQAFADAAGTLPVTTETSTDGTGSILVRQGSKCTRISPARIRMLNPIDENLRGMVASAGPCYKQ